MSSPQSPDLLGYAPEDVEEIIVSWLQPVMRTSVERKPGDPLPFALVRHLDGKEDECSGTADHLISVRVLSRRSDGPVAARDAARTVNRRMIELARYLSDVELSNGDFATIDYVEVHESFRWVEYDDDQVLCKLARYRIGLSYVPV